MSIAARIQELIATKVNLAKLGQLTRNLPDKFFHFTHDLDMLHSILQDGFDLSRFGYSGRKFNAEEITRFDPAGVYCQDLSEVESRNYRPWLIFRLKGRPQALTSPFHFMPDLAKDFAAVGDKLRQKLLAQDVQVIGNVREWIILDLKLIEIIDWKDRDMAVSARLQELVAAASPIDAQEIRRRIKSSVGDKLSDRAQAKSHYYPILEEIRSDGWRLNKRIKDSLWDELSKIEDAGRSELAEHAKARGSWVYLAVTLPKPRDGLSLRTEFNSHNSRLLDYQGSQLLVRVGQNYVQEFTERWQAKNYTIKKLPNEAAFYPE